MTRLRKSIVALMFGCAATAFGAYSLARGSRGAQQPEQEIRQVESRWLHSENDPAALENILADDFIHVLPAGFVSKEEQISFLRKHPARAGRKKHFEDLKVRLYGDIGIANGIVFAAGSNGSPARRTAFTDVFVHRDGKWQAVNAQEIPMPQNRP